MEAGGQEHLKATRKLTFEHERPLREPVLIAHDHHWVEKNTAWVETEGFTRHILCMAKKDWLLSLRFITTRRISLKILKKIAQRQRRLEQFQAYLGWNQADPISKIHFLSKISCLFSNTLRTLDVQISCESDLRCILRLVGNGNSTLRRLGLRLDRDDDITLDLPETIRSVGRTSGPLPYLKEFILFGFGLNEVFSVLAQWIDFSALERLIIRHCHYTDRLLTDMGTTYREKSLALTCLAVEVDDADESCVNNCLKDVLESCDNLQSLLLKWGGKTIPRIVSDTTSRLGSIIQELSVGMIDYREPHNQDRSPVMSLEDIRRLCDDCPNLRQLGMTLPTDRPEETKFGLEINAVDMDYLEDFLNCFTGVTKLRTLYLRQPSTRDCYYHSNIQEHRTFFSIHIQKAATRFLKALSTRKIRPNLQALIWGIDVQSPIYQDGNHLFIPRHCFVSGYQTVPFGGAPEVVAVPVTAHRMRQIVPESNIVAFDQDYRIAGGIPGEFHFL